MEYKTDRSSIKTRESLKKALIILLKTERLEKITIKSIADKANVNRNTFYTHYKDKYDVLEDIEDSFLEYIKIFLHDNPLDRFVNDPQSVAKSIIAMADNEEGFVALMTNWEHSTVFIDRLKNKLVAYYALFYGDSNKYGDDEITTLRYISACLSSGLCFAVRDWYLSGKKDDLAEIIYNFGIFVRQGMTVFEFLK